MLADSADGQEVWGGVFSPGLAFFFDRAEVRGAFGELLAEGVELV